MMMQILEAGGISAVTDNVRKPDEDNLQGYYELESAKRTKDDASWLRDAEGRCVKVIYMLLYDLPPDFDYRVVFMNRDLDEVLASQQQMLKRRGEAGAIGIHGTDETDFRRPTGQSSSLAGYAAEFLGAGYRPPSGRIQSGATGDPNPRIPESGTRPVCHGRRRQSDTVSSTNQRVTIFGLPVHFRPYIVPAGQSECCQPCCAHYSTNMTVFSFFVEFEVLGPIATGLHRSGSRHCTGGFFFWQFPAGFVFGADRVVDLAIEVDLAGFEESPCSVTGEDQTSGDPWSGRVGSDAGRGLHRTRVSAQICLNLKKKAVIGVWEQPGPRFHRLPGPHSAPARIPVNTIFSISSPAIRTITFRQFRGSYRQTAPRVASGKTANPVDRGADRRPPEEQAVLERVGRSGNLQFRAARAESPSLRIGFTVSSCQPCACRTCEGPRAHSRFSARRGRRDRLRKEISGANA